MTLSELKSTFHKWLHIDNTHVLDVILGVVIANCLPGDAIALYLVGPQSSGKTVIIDALDGYGKVFPISTFTTKTLISGNSKEGGDDISFLFRLTKEGRCVITIKDFAPLVSMRHDSRQEIISQIRDIIDGKFSKGFGSGKVITWHGKMGFIIGSVPAIEVYHAINMELGERFLHYRISVDHPYNQADKAFDVCGSEAEMRIELSDAVTTFLQGIEANIKSIPFLETIAQKLISLCCFIAQARTTVARERNDKTITYFPECEGPSRLVKQFTMLAQGIANVQSKEAIDKHVMGIIYKTAWDTLPSQRRRLIQLMIKLGLHHDKKMGTIELSQIMRQPYSSIKIHLEDLMALELVNRTGESTYNWQLSEKCVEMIQKARLGD